MYLLSAGNTITALDGATGKQIWQHKIDGDSTGRGVAFWPGDRNNPERILFTASALKSAGAKAPARLMALDAATGKPSEGFGTNGVVETGVGWNGVPVVFKNLIMLGATVGEVPDGPPGDTRAYDARDGKKLWEFHTVPRPGEVGHETWLDDGWKTSLRREHLGLVHDRRRAARHPLYADRRTSRELLGRRSPRQQPLRELHRRRRRDDRQIQVALPDRPPRSLGLGHAVAADARRHQAERHARFPRSRRSGKTGYMFILNRETGKPIFGVEERPVPKGDVPGEWYSPTQPFPVKPPPLTRVDFNKERDMVRPEDTSAEHVKACQELWDKSGGFYNAGPFTPFMFHEEGAPPKSTIQFPGGTGGVNWGGPAADPSTGYVFVNAHDTSLVGWIEKIRPGQNYGRGTEGSKQPYDRGSVNGAGTVLHVQRADARRERPRDGESSVPASAMGPIGCRQREHR